MQISANMSSAGEEGLQRAGRSLHVATRLVASNWEDSLRGAHPPRPVVPPIFTSSTYRLENAKEGEDLSNSHSKSLGQPYCGCRCRVDSWSGGAEGSLLFASGMSAVITTLFTFLRAGDHAIMCRPCYGGVNAFVEEYLCHLGVDVTWVPVSSLQAYKDTVQENTKLLYTESPTNPTMSVVDLEALAAFAKTIPKLVTAVDTTFASPYLIQPIKLGIDICIHSCTKYMAGHADLIGGCLSFSTSELGDKLHNTQLLMGPCMSPGDAYLLHRSVKTLGLRMERHSQNAMAIAEFLEKHPKVARVHYPGLPSHPDHHVASRLMKRFSGVLSFELKGGKESGIRLVESVCVIVLAVSLGGVESLIEHPASMTHCDSYVSPETKKASGITDSLIRLSVGIEDVDDLIRDLAQALEKA